jgi:carboxypeptidase C (cathepsin A)
MGFPIGAFVHWIGDMLIDRRRTARHPAMGRVDGHMKIANNRCIRAAPTRGAAMCRHSPSSRAEGANASRVRRAASAASVASVCLAVAALAVMPAQAPAHGNSPGASAAEAIAASAPVPSERAIATQHSLTLGRTRLAYTATAGNLLIRDAHGEPDASLFYVAYTRNPQNGEHKARPITFAFNGGPGAASLFLLMGSFGPKRVHTATPMPTPPAPYRVTDNPDSLLETTDLVFVDAVGTGYSRLVGQGDAAQLYSVDGDLDAFVRFIDRYLTTTSRWNSPKFLMGESYGTARAAMLAYRLLERGIALNGVVLLSSILNSYVEAPGYDRRYVFYLPSYAAVAWEHDMLGSPKRPALPALLDEVRAFAAGPYAAALAKGDALADTERDALAAQVARYTGLDPKYVAAAQLRVGPSRFRKQLLHERGASVGRYDARVEGDDRDATSSSPDFDASERYVTSAFDAAFHAHLADDLHYVSTERYRVFNDEALALWHWQHTARSGTQALPYAAGDLGDAMRQNPRLCVFAANGYFDLATPFFSTEYDLAHLGLPAQQRSRITVSHYMSGHMIYLDDNALHLLKTDLVRFYGDCT